MTFGSFKFGFTHRTRPTRSAGARRTPRSSFCAHAHTHARARALYTRAHTRSPTPGSRPAPCPPHLYAAFIIVPCRTLPHHVPSGFTHAHILPAFTPVQFYVPHTLPQFPSSRFAQPAWVPTAPTHTFTFTHPVRRGSHTAHPRSHTRMPQFVYPVPTFLLPTYPFTFYPRFTCYPVPPVPSSPVPHPAPVAPFPSSGYLPPFVRSAAAVRSPPPREFHEFHG